MFSSCSSLTSITIPNGVTSIGSQSWSPDIIYGYTGSEAENYAASNGYVFYALDGESSGDADDDTTESQTGNGNITDDEEENENLMIDTDDNSSGGSSSSGGSTSSGGSSSSSSSSSGSSGNKSSSSSGAYASTTSNVHEVDNTPKTGDGFDPKFMVCIALVLVGCGCFLLAKRKTEQE